MRLGFERLERRELLTTVKVAIEGPDLAYAGDEVSYAVTLTTFNLNPNPLVVEPSISLPLDNLEWKLDGVPWSAEDGTIELEPKVSRVLTATGQVPNDVAYFQLFIAGSATGMVPHSTVVLDQFVNLDTVGAVVAAPQIK